MRRTILEDPRYYLNRHVQWLDFNRRVLEEARDPENPLLERVKFLAITANNLDEFVEVRVSSFLQRIEHGSTERGPDGHSAQEELELVTQSIHAFVREQYKCWNEELLPQLAKESIRRLRVSELDAKAEQCAKNFYNRRAAPMLTPVTVDPSHPFPHVLNNALCISFLLRRRKGGNVQTIFWSTDGTAGAAAAVAGTGGRQRDSLCFAAGDHLRVCAEIDSRVRDRGIRSISNPATATFIWRKKRRAICWTRSTPKWRNGAKAMVRKRRSCCTLGRRFLRSREKSATSWTRSLTILRWRSVIRPPHLMG
jgi:polyphosphate kinase-like protein